MKKISRRNFLKTMGAVAAAGALSACGAASASTSVSASASAGSASSAQAASGTLQVDFWSAPNQAQFDFWSAKAEAYNATGAVVNGQTVQVQVQQMPESPSSEAGIQNAIVTGTVPAASENVSTGFAALLAQDDAVYPLEDESWYQEIVTSRDMASFCEGWKIGGKQYVIPLYINPMSYQWNAKALKAMGYDKAPETLDDFKAVLQAFLDNKDSKLKDLGVAFTMYRAAFTRSDQWWERWYDFQMQYMSFSKGTLWVDGDKLTMDAAAAKKTFELYGMLGNTIMTDQVDTLWTDDVNPVLFSISAPWDISKMTEAGKVYGEDYLYGPTIVEAAGDKAYSFADLVVNHTSDEHRWFAESRKSRENPYRNYYIWRGGKNGGCPNNWGSCFSGPAWEYDKKTGQYYLHLFTKKQCDLNWENKALRQDVYKMMRWWLDKGIDGFRMDVINILSKPEGLPDLPQAPGCLYPNAISACANGPHIHEYLQEMNREVLSHYDLITVGETPDVTPEDAKAYASLDGSELNMIFQFQHVDGREMQNGPKFHTGRFRLSVLKKILSRWQTELEDRAWNSLFWENHDQTRCVSHFGNDGVFRVQSAKMLAVCLYFQRGTPYIYQGQELGMSNTVFRTIADCRDVEERNAYHEMVDLQGMTPEEMMRRINNVGRDQCRTPMQWDDSAQAGFTAGTPWIGVNPNYPEINAAAEEKDPDSVLWFYRRLLQVRKNCPTVQNGHFTLLEPDSEEAFCYTRTGAAETLLVLCSFSEQPYRFCVPRELCGRKASILLSNDDAPAFSPEILLKPYEAVVYQLANR